MHWGSSTHNCFSRKKENISSVRKKEEECGTNKRSDTRVGKREKSFLFDIVSVICVSPLDQVHTVRSMVSPSLLAADSGHLFSFSLSPSFKMKEWERCCFPPVAWYRTLHCDRQGMNQAIERVWNCKTLVTATTCILGYTRMPASSISCLQCPYFPVLTQFRCLVALKGGGVLDEDEGGNWTPIIGWGLSIAPREIRRRGFFVPPNVMPVLGNESFFPPLTWYALKPLQTGIFVSSLTWDDKERNFTRVAYDFPSSEILIWVKWDFPSAIKGNLCIYSIDTFSQQQPSQIDRGKLI